MPTKLEDLPNELIWFIMEYIPPIDLFRVFYNLKERFNELVRLIHYRFNLFYLNNNEYDYFHKQILPNIELNWIESLYIDDISSRLYSINLFQNLRSLIISHLHSEHLALLATKILPELKQLYYLRLNSEFILKDSDVNLLTNVIFSQQMSSLIYCYLAFEDFARISFDHLNITTNKNSSLKILILDRWCLLRDFIQLLHFIPNIQRLTVRLFDTNLKGMIVPSLNKIDDYTSLVPNLIYLRAKLSQISFANATNLLFLRLPSQLQELSLSTWSIDYADGDSWQTVLSSKFPDLKHFRLIVSLDQVPENYSIQTQNDLDKIVKSFNQSQYFIDRNWKVLLNVNERDRLKFVLHTIPYPIENFQTTMFNIQRCTTSSNLIRSTYRSVSKLTLTLHDDYSSHYTEHRYFPQVDQLIFLSNLTNDIHQFESLDYFNNLKNLINLSYITKLNFSEVTHQYPIELINILLTNLPNLICLTLSYRLYVCLRSELMNSIKNLTLMFTIYSSVSPPRTRMRYLLSSKQILTNDLINELIQNFSVSKLQILTLIVRDLAGFHNQFSDWLKTNFSSTDKSFSYDLLLTDKIVRFYF